jgi:hypothetical protein
MGVCGMIVAPAHAKEAAETCPLVVANIPADIQQLQQAYQAAEAAANEAATAYFAAQAQFMQLQNAWRNVVASGAGQAAIQQAYNLMNWAEGEAAAAKEAMAAASAAMTAAQLALDAAMAQAGLTAANLAKCGLYGVIAAEVVVVGWECTDIVSSGNTYVSNGGNGGWLGFAGSTFSNYGYYCNPFNWSW